jgi:hypothetical protein
LPEAVGAQLELAIPDRYLGADVGVTNFTVHFRELYSKAW